jgi:hypothetical protein
MQPNSYTATYPTGEKVGGNAEDFGKTVYEQKIKAWDDAGIAAAKADPARAVAFKGDRRPVDTREAKVFDANKAAERASSEAALGRATQEKISENAMKGEIGKREAAAAGEVAGINAKGEWDVKAAEAKYGSMAPERKAKMIKDYTAALANLEDTDPNKAIIQREFDAMTGVKPKDVAPAAKGKLPANMVEEYKKRAGGDPRKAAELAKADGYSVV